MAYRPFTKGRLTYIPLEELDEWSKLFNKDLVTFHYTQFNDYYNEAIRWNNYCASQTNTEIRFSLDGDLMTAYLHRFGM